MNEPRLNSPAKRHTINVLLVAFAATLATGCADPPVPVGVTLHTAANVARDPAPNAAHRQALGHDNAAFAVAYYQATRAIAPVDGNLVFSPYGISSALGMAYAGASGDGKRALAQTMHFNLPDAALADAWNDADLALGSRGRGKKSADGDDFVLAIDNALWLQRGLPIKAPFLQTLARNRGAGLYEGDFVNDRERTVTAINDWVRERSDGRISTAFSGTFPTSTQLILTNSVYLNAAWRKPFDRERTVSQPFTRLDGTKSPVPMMISADHGKDMLRSRYAAEDGWQAVAIPYDDTNLEFIAILPADGQFLPFEATLDAPKLDHILQALAPAWPMVLMPRFRMESVVPVSETLARMGLGDALQKDGALRGITDGPLVLGAASQRVIVDVKEVGTVAVAFTFLQAPDAAAPPERVVLDRPFLFLVRDRPTGQILFLGRVMDPKA